MLFILPSFRPDLRSWWRMTVRSMQPQFCKENRARKAPTAGAFAEAPDDVAHTESLLQNENGTASAATARRKALAQMLEQVGFAACSAGCTASPSRYANAMACHMLTS